MAEENFSGKSANEIIYIQKKTKKMDVPYAIVVKGYKELFLNTKKLWDLTPEEQTILVASTSKKSNKSPEHTVAAIFKARQITSRTQSKESAFNACYQLLQKENQELLDEMSAENKRIDELTLQASKLEYYQTVIQEMDDYQKAQQSPFSFFINFKNRMAHFLKRQPYKIPPYTQEELEKAKKVWEGFRKKLDIPEDMSDENALNVFLYNSPNPNLHIPFLYVKNVPLLDALQEEYTISTIAMQIIDGSAYEAAKKIIPRKKLSSYVELFQPQKEAKSSPKFPEEHE